MQGNSIEQINQELKQTTRATIITFIIGFFVSLVLCLLASGLAVVSRGTIYGYLDGRIERVPNMILFIIASICTAAMLVFAGFIVYTLYNKQKHRDLLKKELIKLKPSLALGQDYNNLYKRSLELFTNYHFVVFALIVLLWMPIPIIYLTNAL